jgi:hypothetical protein
MAHIQKYLADNNVAGGDHGSHYVYWVPLHIFNDLGIERWKYNRPPDADRVAEIHAFVKQSGRLDGMMYLACVNKKLYCYESNHRREALVGITEIAPILVDIMWDATHEQVKAEFLRLNKAVSVPELYVTDEPMADMDSILAARKAFCEKYKPLKVTTGRPQRPNFNSDNLLDDFVAITKEHKISAEEMMRRLDNLNVRLSHKATDAKLSDKVRDKCTQSGLWLFASTGRLDPKDVVA